MIHPQIQKVFVHTTACGPILYETKINDGVKMNGFIYRTYNICFKRVH